MGRACVSLHRAAGCGDFKRGDAALGSAIITWNTSTNATGQVSYGLDTSYNNALPVATGLTTQHSAMLAGLQPNTNYYFQLVSTSGQYSGTYTGSFSTDASLIVQASQANYSGI